MRTPAQARRGLAIYFAVVTVVSAALEAWIILHGGLGGPYRLLVLPLMCTPALGCVLARLVGREGFGDVSFRWGGSGGTRASLVAWLLPVAVGLVAYGVAWGSGLVEFAAPTTSRFASIASPLLKFVAMVLFALTVGTVLSGLTAFGEELGWRGYMVPRLVDAGVRYPDVVSGLVWCAWHLPLVVWGGYATSAYPLLSAALFVATALPTALLYFRWRMASTSIWPLVIAHGAWNSVIQGVFDRFARGEHATLWVGESGVLAAATMWLAFFMLRRARWAGTTAG